MSSAKPPTPANVRQSCTREEGDTSYFILPPTLSSHCGRTGTSEPSASAHPSYPLGSLDLTRSGEKPPRRRNPSCGRGPAKQP